MKIFEGIVVSTKMQNTAVVEITRRTPHPLYKKLIKRSKKFLVDTNGLELIMGQKVKIVETKQISKNKYFKVVNEEVSKSKAVKAGPRVSAPAKTTRARKPRVAKKENK